MNVHPTQAPRDRSHLENSRPIPWDRTCDAPGWDAARRHLLGLLESRESRQRSRKGATRRKLEEALGAAVLALYATYCVDDGRWLAYSRRNDDYGPAYRRYLHPDLSARAATTVVDFLIESGLAEHRQGGFARNGFGGGRGYRSRVRARASLISLLEDGYGLTPASLGVAEWTELVRLKTPAEYRGGPKALALYEDTDQTRRMRSELHAHNEFLGRFAIDLEPLPSASSRPAIQLDIDNPSDAADRRSRRLYRVFNNERWDHGGRFYGGWWQSTPSADRRRLLIDGEVTIELDYSALHPRFCYHLESIPLAPEVDPYAIEGCAGDGLRDAIKIAFNQLLNVDGPVKLTAPDGVPAKLPKGLRYPELIARIERQHAPIAGWFRKGRGVELQNLDSQIASTVLSFMRFRNICCLPVHDSFIVPRSAEALLGHSMIMAYWAALKSRTGVGAWPVISGWSSDAMRERAEASSGSL